MATLTPAQAAAVNDRGGTLLVSAAAGSGKTRVLVERLLAQVCDPDHPRDIHEFLIITYTRAAAAELRGKISAALNERLAAEPENRRLQRQQNLVYVTPISTVHAFCADLLRGYAHLLDLPSDFAVAEEGESAKLLSRSLEQVLEDAYGELAENAELKAAVDRLGAGRGDEGAASAVEALYRAARCHADPTAWLDRCAEALDMASYQSCEDTPWGKELIDSLHAFAAAKAAALEEAMDDMAGIRVLEERYMDAFRMLRDLLRSLERLSAWDGLRAALETQPAAIRPVRDFADKAFLTRMKNIRARCIDELKGWRAVFSVPSEEAMADLGSSAEALRGAAELAKRLDKAFSAEKRRRRLLDFGDLEHEAIRLLTDRYTGKPTAAAGEIAGRFAEILVDEYQDSNELQERIFRALSRDGKNRFLVGDVKQSIYRFRLADPAIFLEKYRRFAPRDSAGEGEPRKILLSDNFRSRPEILDAVNQVFSAVMSEEVGGLRYGDDEALRPGLPFPPADEPVVELHCMKPTPQEGEDAPDKNRTEARFVAKRIGELLSAGQIEGRPVQPDDIVILLRSVGPSAPDFVEALREAGIPCLCDRGESVLDSRSVEDFLSILQVLDNPRQDIPLAAALSGPAFGFTAGDLAELRAGCRAGGLYDALCASSMEKAQAFRGWLEPLREEARWLPLHTVLRRVYDETGIEAVYGAMAGGRRRRAELHTFFSYAAARAAEGGMTLSRLLSDVDNLRQRHIVLPGEGQAQGGAVQIMSIHKSKGLEFPIVFLAGLSHRFNQEELRRHVLIHPELLAASTVLDEEAGVRCPTFARQALARRIGRENLSEEMRVLYVAMTRARHRLVMTYCSRYLESRLAALAEEAASPAAPDFAGRATDPGCWVLNAALLRADAGALHQLGGRPRRLIRPAYPWTIRYHEDSGGTQGAAVTFTDAPEALPLPEEPELSRRLACTYPHAGATLTPSKVTATQSKGRELDREAAESAEQLPPRPRRALRRPDFAMEGRALTPAEQGTANHLFLQFADYAACTSGEKLAAELERMKVQEFLTPEQAAAVDRAGVLRLFASPLGRRLLHGSVRRELKFSLLVDAGQYNERAAGEQIMLQGVVDCLILEPEGLTVVDFKTDNVSPGKEAARAAVYQGQLRAYAEAVRRMFGRPVRESLLYFLKTGGVVGFSL